MSTIPTDLVESLTQDDIPIKLRCASCNKLVVNAFRLPCCDQNVCEKCQASLPESCPVCMHSPLSADDCKPNKALRLTVKAFLKNEEKKRDKQDTVAPTPAPPTPQPETIPSKTTESIDAPSTEIRTEDLNVAQPEINDILKALQPSPSPAQDANESKTIVQPSAEQSEELRSLDHGKVANSAAVEHSSTVNDGQQAQEQGNDAMWNTFKDQSQSQMFNMGFGLDGMNNGFVQQNWNGVYNPTITMQNGWSGFPNMMGMTGMGMDPMMMSQGMFGGFNGQGMGMNDMNMGMGFDGGYGGWSGQSAIGMGGMNGGFGANAGYYPTGGYNQQSHQGHFNQMQQQQYPFDNSNQNRFRGQARSQRGFERSVGHHASHGQGQVRPPVVGESTFNHQLPMALQDGQHSQQVDMKSQSTEQQQQQKEGLSTDEMSKESSKVPANDGDETKEDDPAVDEIPMDEHVTTGINDKEANQQNEKENPVSTSRTNEDERPIEASRSEKEDAKSPQSEEENIPQPIATVEPSEPPLLDIELDHMNAIPPLGPAVPLGPAAQFATSSVADFVGRGRGAVRGYGRGGSPRGGQRGRGTGRTPSNYEHPGPEPAMLPQQLVGQGVVGAPTGPKAMREGHPNAGFRGRGGFQIAGRGAKIPPVAPVGGGPPLPQESSIRRQRSRSRSPTRSRSPSRRHHRRHRSASPSEDVEDETAEPYDRSQRSRKRRRSHKLDDPDEVEENQGSRPRRSRDSSIGSKHRSHHDKGKHRSSRHDRDRSHERRKRRHRSRSPVDDEVAPAVVIDAADAVQNGNEGRSTSSSRHRPSKRDSTSHRNRDHDRDRKRSRRDRSASASRDHDRARPSRRDSKQHSAAPAVVTATLSEAPTQLQPPTGPREFKIKDRSKQPRDFSSELEHQKAIVREERPNIDAHTLEREARNRERLLRELQRRESLGGGAGGRKRSADDGVSGGGVNGQMQGRGKGEEAVGHRSSRRKVRDERGGEGGQGAGSRKAGRLRGGWQYEDAETDEARAVRVEKEREAGRWR